MRVRNTVYYQNMGQLSRYWGAYIEQYRLYCTYSSSSTSSSSGGSNSSSNNNNNQSTAFSYQVTMRLHTGEVLIDKCEAVYDENGHLLHIKGVDLYISDYVRISPQYGLQVCIYMCVYVYICVCVYMYVSVYIYVCM